MVTNHSKLINPESFCNPGLVVKTKMAGFPEQGTFSANTGKVLGKQIS
jgi:hypothetical protein